MNNLQISSPSSPNPNSNSPANSVPNFKVFYRNPAENSEDIVDFVLRVHLPALVLTEKLIVSVGSQGSIKLIVPTIYHLDITIPFSLDTENSKGYFFQKNCFLFVVFPVCHDTSKVKPSNIVKIALVKKEEEPPVDLHVNSEHEIEVTPNKVTITKKESDSTKKESENAKKEMKDESTYPGLYAHVREWADQKRRGEASETRRESDGPKKAGGKVGRNDSCPCGSGKKYKLCHGQI
eukprot:Phypoly_transcript_17310.p1 GENE.Phypoly_transcript_17310~~Phypoly_transcript_17310.p1  ORF type:complete len:264 (+),score=56.85 Phypoly_transcript_17310:85-792(+)